MRNLKLKFLQAFESASDGVVRIPVLSMLITPIILTFVSFAVLGQDSLAAEPSGPSWVWSVLEFVSGLVLGGYIGRKIGLKERIGRLSDAFLELKQSVEDDTISEQEFRGIWARFKAVFAKL